MLLVIQGIDFRSIFVAVMLLVGHFIVALVHNKLSAAYGCKIYLAGHRVQPDVYILPKGPKDYDYPNYIHVLWSY